MIQVRPSRSITPGCPVQPLPHQVWISSFTTLVSPHMLPSLGNAHRSVGLDRIAGPVP
jgi:hypothetical protein